MDNRTIGRIVSVLIFALLFAFGIHYSEVNCGAKGKDVFLAEQSQRFDKFDAHPQKSVPVAVACMTGILFGAYELLAIGIYKAISRSPRNQETD